MDRLTKSFPVFDCDAHINDPTQIWDYVPESQAGAGAQHLLAGGERGLAQRDPAGDGRWQRPLRALVQPHLHRRPADEQEDHAPAAVDGAAHRRAAGLRPSRRGPRPARPDQGDGSHGDRPGAGHPDHGHHVPARTPKTTRASMSSARPTTTSWWTGAGRCPGGSTARLCCRCRIRSARPRRSSGPRSSAIRWGSSGRSTPRPSTPTRSARP